MNNIARLVVTWLLRAQASSRFCIAQPWASLENNGKEREQGVIGRQNMFFSSLSVSSFFSLLILDNYLKYPENHRKRLWTRQVNCILIMKSSNIFIWWPGINTVSGKSVFDNYHKRTKCWDNIFKKNISQLNLLTAQKIFLICSL